MTSKRPTSVNLDVTCPSKAEQRWRSKRALSAGTDNSSNPQQPEAPRRSGRAAASKAREAMQDTLVSKKAAQSRDSSLAPSTSRGRANNSRASSPAPIEHSRSRSVGTQIEVKAPVAASRRSTRKSLSSQPAVKPARMTRGAKKQEQSALIWGDVDLKTEHVVLHRSSRNSTESLELIFKRVMKPELRDKTSNNEPKVDFITDKTLGYSNSCNPADDGMHGHTSGQNESKLNASINTPLNGQKLCDLSVPPQPPIQGGASPSVQLLEEASMNTHSPSPHTDNYIASPSAITIMKEDSDVLDIGEDATLFLEGLNKERLPPSDEQDQILREALEKINSLSEDIPGDGGLSDAEPGADYDEDAESTSGEQVRLRFRASSMESDDVEDDPPSHSRTSSVLPVEREYEESANEIEDLQQQAQAVNNEPEPIVSTAVGEPVQSPAPPIMRQLTFASDAVLTDGYERTILSSMPTPTSTPRQGSVAPELNPDVCNSEDTVMTDAKEGEQEPIPATHKTESRASQEAAVPECITPMHQDSVEYSQQILEEMHQDQVEHSLQLPDTIHQDQVEHTLQLPDVMEADDVPVVASKSLDTTLPTLEHELALRGDKLIPTESSENTQTPNLINKFTLVPTDQIVDANNRRLSPTPDEVLHIIYDSVPQDARSNLIHESSVVEESTPSQSPSIKAAPANVKEYDAPSTTSVERPFSQAAAVPDTITSPGNQSMQLGAAVSHVHSKHTESIEDALSNSQDIGPQSLEELDQMLNEQNTALGNPDGQPLPQDHRILQVSEVLHPDNRDAVNLESMEDVPQTVSGAEALLRLQHSGPEKDASPQPELDEVTRERLREFPVLSAPYAPGGLSTIQTQFYRINWRYMIDHRVCMICGFHGDDVIERYFSLQADSEAHGENLNLQHDITEKYIFGWHSLLCVRTITDCRLALRGQLENGHITEKAYAPFMEPTDSEWGDEPDGELSEPGDVNTVGDGQTTSSGPKRIQIPSVEGQIRAEQLQTLRTLEAIERGELSLEEEKLLEVLDPKSIPVDSFIKTYEACATQAERDAVVEQMIFYCFQLQVEWFDVDDMVKAQGGPSAVPAPRAVKRRGADKESINWQPRANNPLQPDPPQVFQDKAMADILHFRHDPDPNMIGRQEWVSQRWGAERATRRTTVQAARDEDLPYSGWNPYAQLHPGYETEKEFPIRRVDGKVVEVRAGRTRNQTARIQTAIAITATNSALTSARSTPAGDDNAIRLPESSNGDSAAPVAPVKRGRGRPPKNPQPTDTGPPKPRGKPGPKPKPKPEPSNEPPKPRGKPGPKPRPKPTDQTPALAKVSPAIPATAPARALRNHTKSVEPTAVRATSAELIVLEPEAPIEAAANAETALNPRKRTVTVAGLDDLRKTAPEKRETRRSSKMSAASPSTAGDTNAPLAASPELTSREDGGVFHGRISSSHGRRTFEGIVTSEASPQQTASNSRQSSSGPKIRISAETVREAIASKPTYDSDSESSSEDDDMHDEDFNGSVPRKRAKREEPSASTAAPAPGQEAAHGSSLEQPAKKKRGRPPGSKTRSNLASTPAPAPSTVGRSTRRSMAASSSSMLDDPPRLKLTHHAKEQLDQASGLDSTSNQRSAPSVASTRSGRSGWYEYGFLETAEDKFRLAAAEAALNPNATGRPQRKRKVCETAKEPVVVKRAKKEPTKPSAE